MDKLRELRRLAEAAAEQYPLEKYENDGPDTTYVCPVCEGDGHIDGEHAYTKGSAGITVFGIGDDLVNLEGFTMAANPTTVIELLDRIERLENELRDQLRKQESRDLNGNGR